MLHICIFMEPLYGVFPNISHGFETIFGGNVYLRRSYALAFWYGETYLKT